MVYRPLRSLGRFVLAACAVSLGAASLGAQTPATTAPVMGPNPSRFDIFTGYSYFGAHGDVSPADINYTSINLGAIGSGAYYFNKYIGGEAIYTNHPDGVNDGFSGVSAGPIFRAPMQNFTLFAHGLVGATRLGGPNSEVPATREHEPYTWGVGLTAGGGMDYDLPFFNHRFALRLFEADYRYIHTDFGPTVTIPTGGALGGRVNMSAIELSTGIVTHFGHIIPPPPVKLACSVSPTSVYPGDPIAVTGTATNLDPKKAATYNWSTDGGVISGTGGAVSIATTNVAPGTYTVKGHVSEGVKPGQMADCDPPPVQFTVKPFDPPVLDSCSASPTTIDRGVAGVVEASTITITAHSPQNRPLTYSYTATAGSINGTTGRATLSTTGASPGTITVTCNVMDDKGKSASGTASVRVVAAPPPPPPPPPPAPTASTLCSVSFERDKARPTRVDNEAKACLDDVALALQRSSDAKLSLVGNEDGKETKLDTRAKKPGLEAAKRAVNTKDYLVTDKGIDPSRIVVYTGADDAKTVTTTLVPSGATDPNASASTVDESKVKVVPRTPRKKK